MTDPPRSAVDFAQLLGMLEPSTFIAKGETYRFEEAFDEGALGPGVHNGRSRVL